LTPSPWHGLTPANLHFCEASLRAWVAQPANTLSNLGFLIVGVWVIARARRHRRAAAGLLGWIAIATGIGSAALHGTNTLIGQFMDQGAMFLESAFFVVFGLWRWRRWSRPRLVALYAALVLGSLGLMLRFPTLGIALFVAHVVTFLAIELGLFVRDRGRTRYWAMLAAGGTFALSWGVWWLDLLRVWCDPDNHLFTGHALWHLLGALSFYFWYRYYEQFSRW